MNTTNKQKLRNHVPNEKPPVAVAGAAAVVLIAGVEKPPKDERDAVVIVLGVPKKPELIPVVAGAACPNENAVVVVGAALAAGCPTIVRMYRTRNRHQTDTSNRVAHISR